MENRWLEREMRGRKKDDGGREEEKLLTTDAEVWIDNRKRKARSAVATERRRRSDSILPEAITSLPNFLIRSIVVPSRCGNFLVGHSFCGATDNQ